MEEGGTDFGSWRVAEGLFLIWGDIRLCFCAVFHQKFYQLFDAFQSKSTFVKPVFSDKYLTCHNSSTSANPPIVRTVLLTVSFNEKRAKDNYQQSLWRSITSIGQIPLRECYF